MPRGTQVQRDGLVITVEGGAFQVGLFLGIWAAPWLHVQSAKDHNWEETALQGVGTRCQALKTIRTKIPQGSTHTKPILVTPEEPWVLIIVGGPIRQFPFRYWGNLLRAYWSPWPTFFPIRFRNGTVWTSLNVLLQCFCQLWLGFGAISHEFLMFTWVSDCARVSLTPFGEGYTEQGPCLCFHEYWTLPFSPFSWTKRK